jgi:hypothetical protein
VLDDEPPFGGDLAIKTIVMVQSTSDKSKFYKVTLRGKIPMECACPHFQNRGVECKHMKAARGAV